MKIKINELKEIVNKALNFYGYDNDETIIISEVLLYAQLRGNNQGIVKLIGKGLPKNKDAGEIVIEKETKLSTLLNGNQNNGMVVLKNALEIAINKANEHGFGIVGTNNTSTSTGALGYYADKITKEGFIGIVMASSPETVAAYGSYEPIFGTNPIALGIPSEKDPIILDMATAAMAWYGLIEAKTAGRLLPEDTAYDADGNPTVDPEKAMDGALKTFDKSYKSYGLSMMVEILAGSLVGAAFCGIGDSNNWGNLIIAIDPELLSDKEIFKQKISKLIAKVKSTKKLPNIEEIFIPGEKGNRLAEERVNSGEIEIEDNLYNELKKIIL